MHFIPTNKHWYNRALTLSPVYRSLITCFTLGVILTAWLYGIYFPLQKIIGEYKTDIKQLHKQYRDIDHAQNSCTKTDNNIKKLKETLCSYSASSSLENHHYLKDLIILAQQTHLYVESYIRDTLTDKKWYKKEKIQLVLNGSLENMLAFLTLLKESKKLITYSNILLTHLDKQFQLQIDLSFIKTLPIK